MVTNLLRICVFAVIYWCFFLKLCNYFFKRLSAAFRNLEMKRFSMKEDENRIDN